MPPREVRIASDLLVREIGPEQCIEGFRTVRVAALDDPDLPLSFRSHYEEGLKPRHRQTQHAALHMAVSFWRGQETAVKLAKMFPKHGGYVARVHLTFGRGFNYLDSGAEADAEHLTIWGSPATLAALTIATFPLNTESRAYALCDSQ